ncbi:TrbI/VirB10 family protein [Anabaena azotica]|uniref:TrbI/VirB10 family protein n=1 Tax=Anabaena azotica FACHB-119 TaxID=947527 RepID=A0ABR8DHL2_9NOST|nr:TrbI/VirB10 family protein [Anabaena azotica]MBD2505672.1 TrbI/VirB10 family protein [Anabaena azotica FACHB-119]
MSENNGKVSTVDKLLSLGDDDKKHPDKQLEPESLLVPTKHNFVTSPWSRLLIIAVPFGVGFLGIFLLLNGVFNPSPPQKIAQKPGETITATDEQAQQTEEGDGDARAKLALSDQERELGRINNKEQPTAVPVSKTEKVVPSTPPSPRGAPRTVQNRQPRSTPRRSEQPIRTYRSEPPTRMSFSPRPSISNRTVTQVDPFLQINKLRSIGSYGKIAYAETSDQSTLLPSQNQSRADEPTDINNNDPVEQTTPLWSNDSIEKIRPRWQVVPKSNKSVSLLASNYLPQESQILQGKQTRYLTVGTYATGVIVTPLVQQDTAAKTQGANSNRSVIQLTQDLPDNYGQVAIQAGTSLAVELVSVDGGGGAIAHVRAIIKDNTEYPISAGAISITGEGGKPLIAKKFQDRGGEIARNDVFGGLVSGLGKVGEIINQPDTEEEWEDDDGRTRTRTSGNRRNITGALMEGFFGQVSQNMNQRNQRASQEIMARPNSWYISAGTKVTVTVNRSLELP